MTRKEIRYMELETEAQHLVWEIHFCPVEIECGGFVATQTNSLLKDL